MGRKLVYCCCCSSSHLCLSFSSSSSRRRKRRRKKFVPNPPTAQLEACVAAGGEGEGGRGGRGWGWRILAPSSTPHSSTSTNGPPLPRTAQRRGWLVHLSSLSSPAPPPASQFDGATDGPPSASWQRRHANGTPGRPAGHQAATPNGTGRPAAYQAADPGGSGPSGGGGSGGGGSGSGGDPC